MFVIFNKKILGRFDTVHNVFEPANQIATNLLSSNNIKEENRGMLINLTACERK